MVKKPKQKRGSTPNRIANMGDRRDNMDDRLDERTKFLKEIVGEIKVSITNLEKNINDEFKALNECVSEKFIKSDLNTDTKFLEVNKCIEDKFKHHNDYHTNKEKKYTKIFICLFALIIGCVLSNPAGVVQLASKVMWVLKFLVGIL